MMNKFFRDLCHNNVWLNTDEHTVRHIEKFIVHNVVYDITNIAYNTVVFQGELKKEQIDSINSNLSAIIICHHMTFSNVPILMIGQLIIIASQDYRALMHDIASRFFYPQSDMIVGVTATNGKTSIVQYTSHILRSLGYQAAHISSLGYTDGCRYEYYTTTTPDPVTLYRLSSGIDHVIVELSSHALKQNRAQNLNVKIALLHNVTHEHLDYHVTHDDYLQSKLKIFDYKNLQYVIIASEIFDSININLSKNCVCFTYGYANADLQILSITWQDEICKIELCYQQKKCILETNLQSEWQVKNLIASIAILLCMKNITLDQLTHITKKMPIIPGRLELISSIPSKIYIDYAHSPDAIMNLLQSARRICQGRIILVCGCGGSRDKAKRSIIGQIAAQYADVVIITDDNPRSEDPALIRQAIIGDNINFIDIPVRKSAIEYAIKCSTSCDVVLVCGMGNDAYIYNDQSMTDRSIIEDIICSTNLS